MQQHLRIFSRNNFTLQSSKSLLAFSAAMTFFSSNTSYTLSNLTEHTTRYQGVPAEGNAF